MNHALKQQKEKGGDPWCTPSNVGVSIAPKPNRLTGKPKSSPDPTSPDSLENRSVGVGSVGSVGILLCFFGFCPVPTYPDSLENQLAEKPKPSPDPSSSVSGHFSSVSGLFFRDFWIRSGLLTPNRMNIFFVFHVCECLVGHVCVK